MAGLDEVAVQDVAAHGFLGGGVAGRAGGETGAAASAVPLARSLQRTALGSEQTDSWST